MMEDHREFILDSNEAVEFKFVRSVKDLESEDTSFKPDMSHQIFGSQEIIFGYKGLKIKLYYTPGWLRTYVGMEYEQKLEPKNVPIEADDVMLVIEKFLNHDFYRNIDVFVNSLNDEHLFKPFGELVHRFTWNVDEEAVKKTYEVYYFSGENMTQKFVEYYNRLQSFILWYVDCGNFIDIDDEKWQYFIMYEKYLNDDKETAYAVVGFSTVYLYYAFPHNIRPRISQLLIFPPFRKQSLAVHLLNSIYKQYLSNKSVLDITVESPTTEFQQLRDFVDMCRCESSPCFSYENLQRGFSDEMCTELQSNFKIPKSQARRIYEILLLRTVNKFNEDEQKAYRLKIKRRLNAQFQKLGKMMNRIDERNDEAGMAKILTTNKEGRIDVLDKLYKDLEEQYYHVIYRFISNPIQLT